jgi:hypothetical protein
MASNLDVSPVRAEASAARADFHVRATKYQIDRISLILLQLIAIACSWPWTGISISHIHYKACRNRQILCSSKFVSLPTYMVMEEEHVLGRCITLRAIGVIGILLRRYPGKRAQFHTSIRAEVATQLRAAESKYQDDHHKCVSTTRALTTSRGSDLQRLRLLVL